MLSYPNYLLVKKELAAGVSCRVVCKVTGVSREVVRRIKRGCHYWDRKSSGEIAESAPELLMHGLIPPDLNSDIVKCPTCSARVFPPCLACQVRELKERLKNDTSTDIDPETALVGEENNEATEKADDTALAYLD